MNRGGAWDLAIDSKLDSLYGIEKFEKDRVSLSFEDKKKFFTPFSDKFKNIKLVTIAGTNGKGETARLLAGHLKEEDLKVALWTSPHILSVRERFVFNDSRITPKDFEILLDKVPKNLSYYEALFYIFCEWVSSLKDVDVIILEVGLGGRLDATNFFDADLVCLTSISRDHCHILGNTLEKILFEKLGVCREKTPLISALTSDTLNKKVYEFTESNEITWNNLKENYPKLASMAYWDQNMLLSLTARDALIQGVAIANKLNLSGLPLPKMSPGRFEQMTLENRGFIFIGAHNLDGLRLLVQSIFSRLDLDSNSECFFALSDRPDDEIDTMLEIILSCKRLKQITNVCFFDHPRALSRDRLVSLFASRKKTGKEELKFVESWKKTIVEPSSSKTLILGSYYFIGEFQKHLLSLGATFKS